MTTVVGGVDTHLDVHVAAALDERGGLLGTESFAASPAGYRRLPGLLVGVIGLGIAQLTFVVAARVMQAPRGRPEVLRRHRHSTV